MCSVQHMQEATAIRTRLSRYNTNATPRGSQEIEYQEQQALVR